MVNNRQETNEKNNTILFNVITFELCHKKTSE